MGYKAWNNYDAENRKREREEFQALPLAERMWVYARLLALAGLIIAPAVYMYLK